MRLALILALLPLQVLAGGLDLASQVDGLAVAQLQSIPRNPAGPPDAESCSLVVGNPETPEGLGIAKLGWAVTSEVVQGDLTYVSFAGAVEPGTSGSCRIAAGNVAVFRGGDVLGLVYAAKGAARGIGGLAETGERLRIWDGDYLQRPLADLVMHGDLLVVAQVAQEDRFCEGSVVVPSLYGLPIHLARRLILEAGLQPAAPSADAKDFSRGMEATMPEVQGCSGTGFGYCGFDYASAAGGTLSVTTAGEGEEGSSPVVVGYDMGTCHS